MARETPFFFQTEWCILKFSLIPGRTENKLVVGVEEGWTFKGFTKAWFLICKELNKDMRGRVSWFFVFRSCLA